MKNTPKNIYLVVLQTDQNEYKEPTINASADPSTEILAAFNEKEAAEMERQRLENTAEPWLYDDSTKQDPRKWEVIPIPITKPPKKRPKSTNKVVTTLLEIEKELNCCYGELYKYPKNSEAQMLHKKFWFEHLIDMVNEELTPEDCTDKVIDALEDMNHHAIAAVAMIIKGKYTLTQILSYF